MIITKEFEVEMSHIVRNCSTNRCKHSIHGHSAKIKVSLEARTLDNAQMIYDFGLMKGSIKQFIDSFDHCHVMWSADKEDYINACKQWSDRWIVLPFNPSAEMLSLFFTSAIQAILDCTIKRNEEGTILVHSVEYFETRTGSAKSFNKDMREMLPNIFNISGESPVFSPAVVNDWSTDLYEWFKKGVSKQENLQIAWFENPKLDKQV